MKRCLYILMLWFAAGCQREVTMEPGNAAPGEVPACTGEAQYEFIKATIGGVPRVFDKQPPPGELFYNVHIFDSLDTRRDQLNLIRFNSDSLFVMHLYFLGSRYHQKPLPYTLPHAGQQPGETAELQLLDVASPWYAQCSGCAGDDANYFAYTGARELTITITDTVCSYVKGIFEGTLSTKTGKSLPVQNGTFNIKITRVSKL